MRIAIEKTRLADLVTTQVRTNFLLEEGEEFTLCSAIPQALARAEKCFAASKNKYYRRDGEVFFNPYHSAQYSIFLYFLSNTLFKTSGPSLLADKVYYLNKLLNSLDLYYEIELPDVFFTDHPVGTVLGRAKYGERFSFSQGCTVGNNKGVYPEFGENVRLFSGARILGRCKVGSNVILSSGTYVKDTDIPDFTIVFGQSPNLTFKTREPEYFAR